ncbi:MAG: hypothetical protein GY754_40615 [bacterium]|nr:hypothetical protein [bacterium]
MEEEFAYELRQGYGSSELLIEFDAINDPDTLLTELIQLLKKNKFIFDDIDDVWMNDEIWIHFSSKNGNITITKDIWDLIFIMGNKNQKDILRIDEILINSGRFKKKKNSIFHYIKRSFLNLKNNFSGI